MLVDKRFERRFGHVMRERFPSARRGTDSNLGFAAGNNYGAEHATGGTVAFLNNDTRVEPDWLSEMVKSVVSGREKVVVSQAR